MAVHFNEQEYKSIVERMPFGVLVLEADPERTEPGNHLVCTYCNPYMLELYGIEKEELLGKTFDEIKEMFVVSEDIPLADADKQTLLGENMTGAFPFTYHQKRKNGTHFWIKGYTNWIVPGKLCQSVFYDCTHEVILEGKQHRTQVLLETVMDTTTTPIFWKDAQRRFIGANKAFLDVYGFDSVDVVMGKNDEEMKWHPSPEPFKNIEEHVIKEGMHSDGAEGICLIRGKERRIRASKHPLVLDDQIIGLVGTFEDITEDFRQKEEIQKLNTRLVEALGKARAANEAKNQFMARMSHDMRTPLTTIMGLANIGMIECEDPAERKRYGSIQEGAQYLLTLLTDILDSRKLSEGKIELNKEPVNLREIRNLVEHIVRPGAEEKDIFFSIQTPGNKCLVEADGRRLQQIMLNLLSNAIKATPEGGTVILRITELNSTEDHVDILYEVIDNGIGMSREFQQHMFDEFTQETRPGQVEQGSGLGLAIVQQLVNLMDGSISCESELGKGTTFRVKIPFKRISEEEMEAWLQKTGNRQNLGEKQIREAREDLALDGKKCLICEDVDINAMIIAHGLEKLGIICEIAANGMVGVEKARQEAYDFILMDIRMPIMDGIEAAKEIRRFNATVPIIALSANNYPEDIRRSLDAGMNAHVSKPINPEELIGVIRRFL
ncbi:MAG: response regulator [Lachnospiraceae bacterium]|nr:response regulator [Lachnospiraceae bacterium]